MEFDGPCEWYITVHYCMVARLDNSWLSVITVSKQMVLPPMMAGVSFIQHFIVQQWCLKTCLMSSLLLLFFHGVVVICIIVDFNNLANETSSCPILFRFLRCLSLTYEDRIQSQFKVTANLLDRQETRPFAYLTILKSNSSVWSLFNSSNKNSVLLPWKRMNNWISIYKLDTITADRKLHKN